MGLAEVSFTGFVHWFGSLVSLHFVHWVALIGFIGSSDVFFMGNNLKVLRSFSMLSCEISSSSIVDKRFKIHVVQGFTSEGSDVTG